MGVKLDNKQLDKQLRKELRKEGFQSNFIKPALMFILIAFGLLILYLAVPQPAENQIELLSGKTLREIPASEGYGYDSAMIVELESGKEARVPIEKDTIFRNDREIEIRKITSAGGTVSYKFSRYKN